MIVSPHITAQLHAMLSPHMNSDGVYVDATAGGGRDTLFLASRVGREGYVYAFDIQEKALSQTKDRLASETIKAPVELILDSHERMDLYVKRPLDGVMFNLGYLPGGDPTITTERDSTRAAAEKALSLLKHGGFLSLLCYTGHPGGREEYEALSAYAAQLDMHAAQAVEIRWSNCPKSPPVLILIEKRGAAV